METQLSGNRSLMPIEIFRVSGNIRSPYLDDVSVEEPLEIKVLYRDGKTEVNKNISVTMAGEQVQGLREIFYVKEL